MPDGPEPVEALFRGRLAGFCGYLRARGLPLGLGNEADLGRAADAIHLLQRRAFRDACGAALAKTPEELALVYEGFDRYWTEVDPGPEAPWPASELVPLAPPRRPRESEGRRKGPDRELESPPVAIPIGTYSASAPSSGHIIRVVSERELRALRHGARRFRREVATLPGRRRRRSRHGTIDLRDTVRQSLQNGGEWVELRRERRRPTRAEFVVLWDVSGSMREHESRFFALVHALESASRSARIFAFSTCVEEITGEVRRSGYRRAATVVGERLGRTDGGTRIGRSLSEFARRYGGILHRRTTLLLLSDGWDLGEAELVAQELRRLARRVDRIVWVTPYTRRPGFEPRVGALRAALGEVDLLLGPEDFESRWPLRPYPI